MAAVGLGAFSLSWQVGVDACWGAGAWWQHPRWGAFPPWHHGELVWARRSPVVQIGRAACLEWPTLILGGTWVWRWQVGVVMGGAGHAERHSRCHRGWCVGECGRVVHPGTGETCLGKRGQAGKLALELAWVSCKRAQIRCTWERQVGSAFSTFTY